MKRNVLAVSLPVLVCLLSVGLVTYPAAGPPVPGPTRKAQPRGPALVKINKGPDLVIQKITILNLEHQPKYDQIAFNLLVTVKNIGDRQSGQCSMFILYTRDPAMGISGDQPFVVNSGTVPELQPNATGDVEIHQGLPEAAAKGMCIALVDRAIHNRPYGVVSEWAAFTPGVTTHWMGNTKPGEHNNAFGFMYDFNGLPLPFSWTNPAVP